VSASCACAGFLPFSQVAYKHASMVIQAERQLRRAFPEVPEDPVQQVGCTAPPYITPRAMCVACT
jgi:hypothetical protein